MMGIVELAFLLIMVVGPGGLLLGIVLSPMAPLIRYWTVALFGFAVATAIAGFLGGAVSLP